MCKKFKGQHNLTIAKLANTEVQSTLSILIRIQELLNEPLCISRANEPWRAQEWSSYGGVRMPRLDR